MQFLFSNSRSLQKITSLFIYKDVCIDTGSVQTIVNVRFEPQTNLERAIYEDQDNVFELSGKVQRGYK